MMSYQEPLPQSSAMQMPYVLAHSYDSMATDGAYKVSMGCFSGSTTHGYMHTLPSVYGTLYGSAPAPPQLYPGHGTNISPDTAAEHIAAISAEYQATSLTTAPPRGHASRYYANHVTTVHPYGASHASHDVTTSSQKTAGSRDTTSALKDWLRQHRKKPYPSKGDKIMLAMVSNMTLNQVSTWFANARRRLKKCKREANNDSHSDTEDDTNKSDKDNRTSDRVPNCYTEQEKPTVDDNNTCDENSTADIRPPRLVRKCVQSLFSPDSRSDMVMDNSSSPDNSYGEVIPTPPLTDNKHTLLVADSSQLSHSTTASTHRHCTATYETHAVIAINTKVESKKSKIWSIDEILGTKTETPETESDDVCVGSEIRDYVQTGIQSSGYLVEYPVSSEPQSRTASDNACTFTFSASSNNMLELQQ